MNYLNSVVTIGTTPVRILIDREGLNSKRNSYILYNISTSGQVISISVGQDAVVGTGAVLSVGGSLDKTINQNPEQTFFTAVASGAGATLSIYEEVSNDL